MSRLRWLTAGESHGPALVATLEGLPAGVPITTEAVAGHLARRRLGHGRGARMKFERDEVTFLGGVRHGLTLGSPVAVMVGNTEWPKWDQVMSPDPVDPSVLAGLARNAPLTRPRPGHADLAGMQKYGFDEARPVLERASARETAARVALGAVARSYLAETAGIGIVSHVVELASVRAPHGVYPTPADVAALDADPVRCLDADASEAMVAEIDQAHKDGDTLGGVVEVLAYHVPVGLGSHVHWDRRLDARLAAALMGIQAIKGVEIGDGFESAGVPGAPAHAEIARTGE
ncbi:chorismate synthase, partial [Streptomyces sp. NPDC005899]|uniref:chorismate synthase n=1 Tax=Streptomyces sp. NPDC005899 TaxID=3155716 RepID=UPI0033DFC3A6